MDVIKIHRPVSKFDIDLALFRRSNASKQIGKTFAKPNRACQKVLGELGVVLKTSQSRTEPKFLSLAMTYPSHLTLICPNNFDNDDILHVLPQKVLS